MIKLPKANLTILLVLMVCTTAFTPALATDEPQSDFRALVASESDPSKRPLQGQVKYSEISTWSGRWSGTVKIDSVNMTPLRSQSDPVRAGLESRYLRPGRAGKLQVDFAVSGNVVKLQPTRVFIQGQERDDLMRMLAEGEVNDYKRHSRTMRSPIEDREWETEPPRVRTAQQLKEDITAQEQRIARIGATMSQQSDCGACP